VARKDTLANRSLRIGGSTLAAFDTGPKLSELYRSDKEKTRRK